MCCGTGIKERTNVQPVGSQEIASFSFDEHHQLRHDDSSLRWYWPPQLGADLSKGFETFIKHDDSVDEHLDGLLAAIVKLEQNGGQRVVADFVTWRGMLTKVYIVPFRTF